MTDQPDQPVSRPDRPHAACPSTSTPPPGRSARSRRSPGAPNVVVVLIDDMGFGASSAYGGPCEMPTAERLADEGLRYSRFHVTPLCSPTRQALMTGRNHHSVGMGVTSEMSTPGARLPRLPPGERRDDRPDPQRQRLLHGGGRQVAPDPAGGGEPVGSVPALADGRGLRLLLRLHGRGDEPLVPAALPGPLRRRARPAARGRLPPLRGPRRPRDRLGREPAGDHARAAVLHLPRARARRTRRSTSRRSGATSTPAGSTPAGTPSASRPWPARRSSASCPASAELAPWAEGVPHWDELDETEQRVAARFMETYAGFAEHADVQIGRFVDALEEMGVLDDTLFFYLLGDNGASGEGGPRGTFREHLVGPRHPGRHRRHGRPARHAGRPHDVRHLPGRLGAGDEHAVPLDQAGRAPRRHPRRDDRALGQRDRRARRGPAPVAPRHRRAADDPRGRPGSPAPETVRRRRRSSPIEGTSLRYTFDDADAPRTGTPRSTSR